MRHFIVSIVAVICLSLTAADAQHIRNTDYSPDKVLKSNARVNPSTLAMELSIPVGGYPGRAGGGLPLSVSYSSKVWEYQKTVTWQTNLGLTVHDVGAKYSKRTAAGWSSSLDVPRIDYKFDTYEQSYQGGPDYDGQIYAPAPWENPPNNYLYYVKRLNLTMPDGSTHEFRASDTPIQCGTINGGCTSTDFTGTFLSVDGSKMRLESGASASTLYLPDGSKYIFGGTNFSIASPNSATEFYDRNGNRMIYNPTSRQWVDSIGRVIYNPLPNNWDGTQHQAVETQTFQYPGYGGGSYPVSFVWSALENALLSTEPLRYAVGRYCNGQEPIPLSPYLFLGGDANNRPCDTGGLFNPVVLSRITLPNGQYYEFKYNVYGEITRINYPNGAYERFQYGVLPPVQVGSPTYDVVNRGVTNRWLSVNGDGNEVAWTYSATRGTLQNYAPYKVTTTNPDGSYTEQYIADEIDENVTRPYGFAVSKTGHSYEDRVYGSGTLLRRNLTSYTQTGALPGGWSQANRDMRPSTQVAMTFEPGEANALVTLTETTYDSNSDPTYFAALNVTSVKTYNYKVVNSSTAASANIATALSWFASDLPARTVETDYLYSEGYRVKNINGLVSETRTKDASQAVTSKTQITYDIYGFLTNTPNSTRWTDPGQLRGLPNVTRSYSNVGTGQYVETKAQYDPMGNLRYSWDGNDNRTETEYASTYDYAYPTRVITPVPDNLGVHGSMTPLETSTSYDFNTGLVTSVTDPNNASSSMSYDTMLRPTFSQAPNGQQTTTDYGAGTNESTRWVKVRTQIDWANWKEVISKYDGLGRTIETRSVDPSTGDVYVTTGYDNMGRVLFVTNPYRNGESVYTTTTGYDALGRVQSVSLPGGSSSSTTYSLATSGPEIGTVETTTDEANRVKRTIEDVFDNLIRVDEPNATTGSLGPINDPAQATRYTYDGNENLKQIFQGDQVRTFSYDSLNRLTQATNPESGTFQFSYYSNGNLWTKTDSRGVTTTFTYDKINRATRKDYSDSTPDITYYYDSPSATNSRGRLTRVFSSASETLYTGFDPNGKVTSSQQNTEDSTYPFTYAYDLAGNMISQSYPSGKTITSTYDASGDLAQVSRPLGMATYKYASAFKYTAAGEVEKVKFGNGRWEKTEYNPRRQITQIALGFTENDTGVWKSNFEYGTLQGGNVNASLNNGSPARQTITVPPVDGVAGFTAVQSYEYDPLDRLKSANETIGAQTWKQTFIYDRFGNKNFDTANTTTLGSCPAPVCNPTISQANNRVDSNGYDGAGNVASDAEGRSFTYDAENRQITATGSNLSMVYAYDGNGERVKSYNALTNQTTYFVYDAGGNLAAEYTVNVPPPTLAWISYTTHDALGSPRVITNSYGDLKARRDFYPFGEEINAGVGPRIQNQRYSATADDTRVKFATYQRDIETGLDFAQSRYFSPKLGRFTSPDEFKGGPDELFDFTENASNNPTFYADLRNPQSLNKYQYGYNSPYRHNDPTGHCPPCWPIIEIVATVADIVATVDTFRDPNASRTEKVATAAGTVIGIMAPGGGYGVAAKYATKALRREATEITAKAADKVADVVKSANKVDPSPRVPMSKRVPPPSRKQREDVYNRNKEKNNGKLKCDICGGQMERAKKDRKGVSPKPNSASVDHIKARSKGGDNDPSNLRGACRKCNRDKSDKDP